MLIKNTQLLINTFYARTHTLPVNRSSASLVEVHVVQLYVPCLDLFNVGLSSMKPCRPLSQTQRTVPNQTMGGVGWGVVCSLYSWLLLGDWQPWFSPFFFWDSPIASRGVDAPLRRYVECRKSPLSFSLAPDLSSPLSVFNQEAAYKSNWLAAMRRVTARADTLTPPWFHQRERHGGLEREICPQRVISLGLFHCLSNGANWFYTHTQRTYRLLARIKFNTACAEC